MDEERFEELAALNAAGLLSPAEHAEYQALRAAQAPDAPSAAAAFGDLAALLITLNTPVCRPADSLKRRLLNQVRPPAQEDPPPFPVLPIAQAQDGELAFANTESEGSWLPLPVAGAFVKPLSVDTRRGYAVVLGKLDAGAHYPAHPHRHAESLYVLTGDLHIGSRKLTAGDYHCAGAGSRHEVNFSETGCTILAVVSIEDLRHQFAGTH